jgi:hypothetical protein
MMEGIISENGKVEKINTPVGLAVAFFAFLPCLILSGSLPDAATMANHPVQLVVLCALADICLGFFIVGGAYAFRMKNKGYEKIVAAMTHRFQEQGFEIEFVVLYDCCIIPCSYIRFTPTGTDEGQTDDNLGVFNIHDWKPLEGKWEMTETGPQKSWLRSLIRMRTLEFHIVESLV